MDVVRITELQPKTYVEQGDYIAIDNQSDGTKKVQFTNLLDDTLSQENKIAPANVVGDKIATVRDTMEDEIATIRAAVGSPLKASTVAQMTDKNKIYVYVGSESGYTNGNWYYWNGSAWTSGGVYNSVAVVTDPTLTLSGVPADAKATGDEIGNLKSDLTYTGNGTTQVTMSAYASRWISYEDGSVNAHNDYSAAKTSADNVRIRIPIGCKRILFNGIRFNFSGTAGWATYTTDTGSATSAFIRGGQTTYIDVQSGDKFFAISSAKVNGSVLTSFDIVYVYETGLSENALNGSNIVTETVSLIDGKYVLSTNGGVYNAPNFAIYEKHEIPYGCKKILLPDVRYNFAGNAGWATYSTARGASIDAYVKGGRTSCIEVGSSDKYFAFTSYKNLSATIIYIMDDLAESLFDMQYPFNEKMIQFVGDSVTYGYDDDNSGAQLTNPYPKLVGQQLKTIVENRGISSASLMDGVMGDNTPTPVAWVNAYTTLYDGFDVVGAMIGINDCYRGYTLGQFSDTTADTFYGALHIFIKGMRNKYLPEDGKHFFMMIYPHYEGRPATWDDFCNAIIEVSDYYSVPVLDLRKECGISPYNDSTYKYWRLSGGIHSAHLTQLGCNVVASVISKYIERMF